MNIRPFMAAKPLGARAKGAGILRTKPKIKWDKDRGKEPQRPREDFPWFWGWDRSKDDQQDFDGRGKEPDGNRWNDLALHAGVQGSGQGAQGEGLNAMKVKP